MSTLSRRFFLVAGAVGTGGLLLGVGYSSPPSAKSRLGDKQVFAPAGGQVALNGWVKITPDNRVIVAVPRSEMGQGVHTALAMLVAEELDADWATVSTESAPVAGIYANAALLLNVVPLMSDDDGLLARLARGSMQRLGYALSLQVTGGSSSVRDAWEPMRLAGASARALLVDAAAAQWRVNAQEITMSQGVVSHAASGKKATFGELAQASSTLEPRTDVVFKNPKDYRLIGQPVARTDLAGKVNGTAVFGIDVRLPDMLYASIRQCPVLGGSVAQMDPSAARKMPGVVDVFQLDTHAVVVVAQSHWAAKSALDALQVGWNEGPNAQLDSAQIRTLLLQGLDGAGGSGFRDTGSAEAQLGKGVNVLSADYEAPFLAHAAMEPINCVAQFKDGALTLWNGTQVPSLARWRASKIAGIDADKVTVHVTYLGGGFGRRLETDMVEQATAIAMRTAGRPVKLLWSREEDMQHDMYRPVAMSRFKALLDDAGRPLAWSNRVAAPSIALASMERLLPAMAMDSPDKNHIEGAFDLPYDIPNVQVRQIRVKTPVPVGSWRSVGHSYNGFFTECFIDELAHAAKKDPFEYRRSLLGNKPHHKAVLELVASKAGWGQALPAGRARGIALHESFGSWCAQVAEVSLADGVPRVHRVVCAIDCGVVVNPDTVAAQMESAIVYGLSAALYGEITIKAGRVEQSNFSNYDAIKLATMPKIEVHIVPSTAPPGGVGEPGTPPIAPAVANALFTLTGKRFRKLPLRV